MSDSRLEYHRKPSHRIGTTNEDRSPSPSPIANISHYVLKNIKMKLSLPLSIAVVIGSASAFAPTQKAFVSSKLPLFGSFLTPASIEKMLRKECPYFSISLRV
jgi:hypothetical protein